MATEQLSEQLRLVMERQGALENALMLERQARAEAEQRLSVALGEVGGRADAAVATDSAPSLILRRPASSLTGCRRKPCADMVLHTSRLDTYEKLRLEVTEIAQAKVMTVNPVPMEVDALPL